MVVYWFGYLLCYIVSLIFCPIRVVGRENLPKNGAYILAANHQSNFDPEIIGLTHPRLRPLAYLTKDSLFKNRLLGWIIKHLGGFPVKRGTADIGALKESIRRIKQGIPLVMFPEGTRKRPEKMQEVHTGIAFLASKTGVPVIPVFIQGSERVLPAGAVIPRRHPVTVIFGKPSRYDRTSSYEEIARRIREEIYALAQTVQ